ncbi:MAG: BofC C-terminal domain-containing protein [Acutalibacteraceae bacterium]|nr:BofC C-terminal domain-containing protein [Acutalibacteraceae bacterium]
MSKKSIISLLVITLTLSVALASILFIHHSQRENNYLVLCEEDGTVMLKQGDKIINIYDDIVLDVLPNEDREALDEGIIINSEEQLLSIIEDYDG